MANLVSGSEFEIGSIGIGKNGANPVFATLSNGNIAAVWEQTLVFADGSFTDVDGAIFARVFKADGTAVTDTFQVNTTTAGRQFSPDLAALEGGGFAVSWTSEAPIGSGHNDTDVLARVFGNGGAASTGELVASVDDPAPNSTADDNMNGGIAALAGGGFAVIWSVGLLDGVAAQVFEKSGAKTGGEVAIDDDLLFLPDVLQLANGNVVTANGAGQTVVLRISNAALTGAPAGFAGAAGPVEVVLTGTPGTTDKERPALADLGGGRFAVAYTEEVTLTTANLRVDILAADGTVQNTATIALPYSYTDPFAEHEILGLSSGGFALAWTVEDANRIGVMLQLFDGSGVAQGDAFLVNTVETGDQKMPTLTETADGRLLVGFFSGDEVFVKDTLRGVLVDLGGGSGRNLVEGTDDGERLDGTAAADELLGKGGNDRIFGKGGKDLADGGAGRDVIDGGTGNDTLTGGSEADTFVFGRRGGKDTITDFEDDVDTIRLDDANWRGNLSKAKLIKKFAEVDGADIVFDFGKNELRIENFTNLGELKDDLAIV